MPHRLLISATAIAAVLATPAFAAAADGPRRGGPDRHFRGHQGGGQQWYESRRGHRLRHHNRHNDDGDDVALLIGGAILGFALNSAVNSGNRGYAPSYGYAEPTYNYGPPPSYGSSYGYAPPPPSYGYADPGYGYGAPSYAGQSCGQVREGRTATGAVIGGIVGGLVGNGVAAPKNRGEGTAVGAVLGSVVGGSIGSTSSDCGYVRGPATGYANAGGWRDSGYIYPVGVAPPQGYQNYPQGGYADPGYSGSGYPGSGYPSSGYPSSGYGYGEDELYGGPSGSSQECEIVYRITQYPDGREVREPVEACRDPQYGDWSVRN